jgi:DUF1365 family protein
VVSASCLYEGTIRHRRHAQRRGEFCHRISLAYVDLDELPRLLGGRLASRRPGLLRLRRRDYLGDASAPLADAVREIVHAQIGRRVEGPIRLLTQLRGFGHAFNPVSFYYCFDADGERMAAVVAEVTNTPWGERHSYVLRADGARVDAAFAKQLHVSPFMAMDQRYRARLSTPAQSLSVHLESYERADLVFDATLSLQRHELTGPRVARALVRHAFAALRTLALIYGHAAALRLRGVSTHRHPGHGHA